MVNYSNMYVIDGKLGVFTNYGGDKVYTGKVYGKHNEILMTVKDGDKFYSYWGAKVTDPSATMATFPVSEYQENLNVIKKNEEGLLANDIKEVTLDTSKANSATIGLLRNGDKAVDGAITVTSGGGTGGSGAAHDTFVKISNGTTGQTFATGSKVEAIVDNGATTGIKINGENYTIKSGSKVSVTQNDKTTTITVDGEATVITDTDTKYTKGNGIAIDKANAISVKLNKDEKNLVVDGSGLALNTALTGIQSITGAGEGKISFEGATVKVNQNTFNKDGRIQNVEKGTENTDAVNFGQLKETVAAGDTDVHIKAGNYTVDKDNKVSMNLVDKAGKSQGTVTITGVAKAEDVAVVYDKNKTSLRSTNATLQTSSGKEEAVDSIALGNGASAVKGSVAIGNGASVVEGSNGLGGVALGYKAHAGYKGTSLGSNAISGREGTTLVGANTNSGSLYTTVVGTDSVINSDGTTYKVSFTGIKKELNVQGATATVVGSKNTVDNKNGKVYSGVANNVMGSANTVEGSNGVTIQGTGNKVTDAYKDMNIDAFEAYNIGKGDYSALAKKKSGAVAVIGGANNVSKQTDSTVIGYDNRLIGGAENISHDVFMAGSHNTLTNVSDSIVMGNKNTIEGVSNVISFGHQNTISASANNAVAIGNGAGVSVEGGVALGVGSVASTAAGALGYGAAEGETGIAWKATNGAVSVGSSVEGKEITRQITNVAAGTEDTDAVNVAQLKKVSEAAASASQGWKLKTQNGNASDVKPGATVEFDGDANIQVGNDGNKVSVTLKKQLTGIQSITGEGAGSISFANGGKVKVNDVIIEKGGKITGVAAGEVSSTSTDAINGSQLHAVKETANKGWNLSTGKGKAVNVAPGETVGFSGDDNIVVSNTGKNVVVKLGKELTGLTSVTTKNAYVTNVDASNNKSVTNVGYVNNQIAGVTLTEGKGISITDKKINVKLKDGEENLQVDETGLYLRKDLTGMESITGVGGGKISFATGGNVTINNITFNNDGRIQNVANGTENTDAVNFSQLQAVKNELIASDKDTHIDTSKVYNVDANNQIKLDVLDKDGKKLDQQVVINDVAKASDVGDVSKIADDLKNGGNKPTTVVDAVNNLNNKVGDLNYVEGGKGNYVTNGETTTTSIGKLDKALKDVADTAAKQHTTVSGSGNIVVEDPTTNTDGGKNYNVKLADNITVNSVTANTFKADQTVMDKDGLKVGDKVSVTATAVTAGKTSISDEGVKVGDKTYISADGLNANGQHITNVKAGEADTDAVNYGQLKDTNNRINGVENQVISNSNRINQLGNRVNKVGAGAAALAALHPMDFDPDDKLTFSAGYGNYGGENAAAIGAYYRPDEKVMFSVGGTVGNGENMVNAGISFALDRTNHVSNSRTALAREVIDLRGQLAVMGAKMAKMEKALGMLDETKTKLFPDIPANHWAYEYIAKLAGNGYIEGYPDGNFGGDRLMTRYEFAAMLYRAIENGAALEEKIIKEFEPELGRIRVDRISGEDGDRDKIERVRVNDTKGERDHYGNKLAK
ncbi:YadA-like family protein [Phascolarctobacterium succinatutens]|uniref:YadA-like family protein n=1 Tax=Phascolarctobacterium succinatutens TaxID=626940 RepID=UPI0023F3AF08|nr:YadA-like family protein [Phascolarctobacterium succinatutens]